MSSSAANAAVPEPFPTEAEVLGRAAGENFPVALRVLPTALRGHLMAVYGYARLVDQLGDDYRGDRLAALDCVETQLRQAELSQTQRSQTHRSQAEPEPLRPEDVHPLIWRAVRTAHHVGADPQLLRDLIEANRRDQVVHRYETYDQLVDYCRFSANPVGRLVLAIFGVSTPERDARSDAVCTALQIAEHLQDVAEDAVAGRTYLPADDLARFGIPDRSWQAPGPATSAQRALIAFEVARARHLLAEGYPLVASLRGWARVAVAAFVAGGVATLDALADAGFDPLVSTPRPRPRSLALAMARIWAHPGAGPAGVGSVAAAPAPRGSVAVLPAGRPPLGGGRP
jgi:squalene synthase HpnC